MPLLMATPEEALEAARLAAKDRVDKRQKADAEWRRFLESTPPNVSVKIANLFGQYHSSSVNKDFSLRRVEIELFCETDGGPRLFATGTEYVFAKARAWAFITYTCKNCGTRWKVFSLVIDQNKDRPADGEVMKLGEFPPFGAPISKRIGKLLGDGDLELYRKGLRAEAQGLGVGAASYFRRIVDNQWKQLVAEIREAAAKLGYGKLDVFDAAIKETQFSNAVEMLKDAIPPKLLILDGENPLTLLYKPLSVQLHALSDEECLQQAADIRLVLIALLETIADVLKSKDDLKEAANRLKQIRS
jgi:hypothetical protein